MLVKAARKVNPTVNVHHDIMMVLTKKDHFTLKDQERLRKIDPSFNWTSNHWFHPLKVTSVTWHPSIELLHEHENREGYTRRILENWPDASLMMVKRDKRDKHITSVSVMRMDGDNIDVSVTPHPPAKFGSIPSNIQFHELLTVSHAKSSGNTEVYRRVTLGDLALTPDGPVDVTRFRHPSLTITKPEPVTELLDVPEAMPTARKACCVPVKDAEISKALRRIVDFLYGPYRTGWAR